MENKAFLWFGVLTMVFSFALLSGYTVQFSAESFVVFVGIMLMPVSMASFAAGLLEGSLQKVMLIFVIYVIFFGMIFLAPFLL